MVTDTFKKDKIMFEKFNLKENPFRTVPALGNDVVWAGFSAIKKKFEKRIKKSIRIQNSSIVLNWGEYGSGKTHAARYFSKIENPKGKMPLGNYIYTYLTNLISTKSL